MIETEVLRSENKEAIPGRARLLLEGMVATD